MLRSLLRMSVLCSGFLDQPPLLLMLMRSITLYVTQCKKDNMKPSLMQMQVPSLFFPG